MITVKRRRGRRLVLLNGLHIGLIETRIKDQFRNRAYGLEFVFVPNETSPIKAHYNYRAKTIREIVWYMSRHVSGLSDQS